MRTGGLQLHLVHTSPASIAYLVDLRPLDLPLHVPLHYGAQVRDVVRVGLNDVCGAHEEVQLFLHGEDSESVLVLDLGDLAGVAGQDAVELGGLFDDGGAGDADVGSGDEGGRGVEVGGIEEFVGVK